MTAKTATGTGWELRLGRWQDVLADVDMVDAVITDPPYDERTHAAAAAAAGRDPKTMRDPRKIPSGLLYGPWSDDDVRELCAWASNAASGWCVVITNHKHARIVEFEMSKTRYVFAPVAWVAPGSRVRLLGDGPANWTCWVVVSRPRSKKFASWGSLPGAYIKTNHDLVLSGGKPLSLMRAIIRDYTRPGDLVCDPCAGGGTTLLAAVMEGRRAIGSEMDPATFEKARQRLVGVGPSSDVQPNLFDKEQEQ